MPKTKKKLKPHEMVCMNCGDTDIEARAWVDPNDKSFISWTEGDESENWCNTCEDHTAQGTREEYLKQKEDEIEES